MKPVSVEVAMDYFLPTHVINQQTAESIWSNEANSQETKVYYSLEFIQYCFRQNKLRLANWCLVYITATSLIQQRDILGVSTSQEPGFSSHRWWIDTQNSQQRYFRWTNWTPLRGYYLLDFRARYGHLSRANQARLIFQNSHGLRRIPEAVFSQAYLSFWASGYADWINSVQNFWGDADVTDGVVCIDRSLSSPGLRVYAANVHAHKIPTMLMKGPQFG